MSIPKKPELITTNLEHELMIDSEHLNDEIRDQPLLFRKWTNLLSQVQHKASMIKLHLEEREAELVTTFSGNGKGMKVKEIEAAVTLDPTIKQFRRELIEADTLVQEYEGIVRAWHQRHEMLKDLAANFRKELL